MRRLHRARSHVRRGIFGHHLGRLQVLGPIMLWVALVLTVISMVVYFWQNWHIVRDAEE